MTALSEVKVGQRIRYQRPNGIGRNGVEYKTATGKVALKYPTHVVVNAGGRHGRPAVVTPENFSGLA